MKIAAVHAIANLAKQPVPDVVNRSLPCEQLHFRSRILHPETGRPAPHHRSVLRRGKAAMDSGVARKQIADWDAYRLQLRELMGYESKLTRQLYDTARRNPQRVVFAEAFTQYAESRR